MLWIFENYFYYFQIYTHGPRLDTIHKFIPKHLLPTEYGGTAFSFDNFEWRQTIFNDSVYYHQLETLMFQNHLENPESNL